MAKRLLIMAFLPAESNVRMSVFAVVQYTILLLSPYPFLRHFKPRISS